METVLKKIKTNWEQIVTYILGGICLVAFVAGVILMVYHIATTGFIDHNGSY